MSRSALLNEAQSTAVVGFYGSLEKDLQLQRFTDLTASYRRYFKDNRSLDYFSTPGRTELIGNHTDHNHGKVVAASINLDTVACAMPTTDHAITIHSNGYNEVIRVAVGETQLRPGEAGTSTALVRGIVAALLSFGYRVGGFQACVTSSVIAGSGLSSSASFEMLISTILNHFYNNGAIPLVSLAQAARQAENQYFAKPCGLMDQLACAYGGIIAIDFKDEKHPLIKSITQPLPRTELLLVNTGGSHADLTADYAEITAEMKAVAGHFGKTSARELTDLFADSTPLKSLPNLRSILRVYHFCEENKRVELLVRALENGDNQTYLKLIRASGRSSCMYLQNIYASHHPLDQRLSVAFMLTEYFIRTRGLEAQSAFRVHGGGFAGTIQVYLPAGYSRLFTEYMEGFFGQNSVLPLKLRSAPTLCLISKDL